ncbi:hypothetical protein LQ327_15040 [Actinomycetospora endophytica]|uniref:Zinc finger protein n=1 Tax=Actinomycetospora endophytica TaxID=2291215 RepID=A0ABS8P8U5_9PSEU|nr:hypothetical protein [Actinomycetospora endophytica]MCD2194687.1 hypothetical protein [Actinomycetospora endophytica]
MIPDESDTPDRVLDELDTPSFDAAFHVTDRLAVHGAECVCPRCAGQLAVLLAELARALA